ncbi:MAG: DUF3021 family protein [Collinsella sp.]|nr:DUF3021 family protein [Collinsella sp.]
MMRKDIVDTEVRAQDQNARGFFVALCATFTAVMLACMALGMMFADEGARQGILFCWSIFFACACATGLQFLFFTPILIKRMSYSLRLILFGFCLYALLALLAVILAWFPSHDLGAWMSFTMIYLGIYAATSVIFAVKRRREGRLLNDRLSEYRKGDH